MHESRIVADLVARAETESAGSPQAIRALTFRIGALSGIPPHALRNGVAEQAAARWGHRPEIIVDQSQDPVEPNALGVVLVSIRMEA
jgi:Zn finger protein HypA/HybF involved in hydrogenase expression